MFEEYFSRIVDIRSNRYVLFGDFLEGVSWGVGVTVQRALLRLSYLLLYLCAICNFNDMFWVRVRFKDLIKWVVFQSC